MYTNKGIYYSDAGKILTVSNGERTVFIGYSYEPAQDDTPTITEHEINLDTLVRQGSIMTCDYGDGKQVQIGYKSGRTYSDWKTTIVKWRYTNDDQLAIILNKDESDEDAERYSRMQEWRNWASDFAKRITSLT